MDQGVPQGCWQGDDDRTFPFTVSRSQLRRRHESHSRLLEQDSTLNFEKRRNVPIVYDRDLVQATLVGMKRISEIRAKRERAFFKARYVRVFGWQAGWRRGSWKLSLGRYAVGNGVRGWRAVRGVLGGG